MRLDFNVLWVDDQPNSIDAQIEGISKDIADEGFHFNVTKCTNVEEAMQVLGDGVFVDDIDLILVDWDLGADRRGQDAISQIRERVHYRNVIFYSAQTSAQDLRAHAYSNNLEGVYCTSRELLTDEVHDVFLSIVRRVLDLDHSRGVVIGATCDIDQTVMSCLRHISVAATADENIALLKKAQELIRLQAGKSAEAAARAEAAGQLTDLFDMYDVFPAYARARVLHFALGNLAALSSHAVAQTAVNDYMQQVVPHRNKLGHKVLTPAGKKAIASADSTTIDLESLRSIRRLILNQRAQLDELMKALAPQV